MNGSLYLFPRNHRITPPRTVKLIAVLLETGFIGDPLGDSIYLSGSELTKHITFTGCSPHLEFTPPANGSRDFCHIAIHGPYDRPRMITGPHTQKPRCPNCDQRASDWHVLETAWHASGEIARYPCPSCGVANAIDQWRWRRHAAFGRLLIAVRSVFHGEGVPSDAFMHLLHDQTGVAWEFGWAATVPVS